MKRILLTGMSGAGKSALPRAPASDGILCADLDDGWMRGVGGETMIGLPASRHIPTGPSYQQPVP